MAIIDRSEISAILKDNDTEILSQIEVSDQEYDWLLQYVRNQVNTASHLGTARPDEIVALALVQIAIRTYNEGNYWTYFNDEIGRPVSPSKQQYLAQIFSQTIKEYNLFELKTDSSKSVHVENIKAHSFVPNSYLYNYFDFLFSFYDRNLFRQITNDIYDDIDDLISYIASSQNDGENIVVDDSKGKAAKSYKLLKATRTLIANATTSVIRDLFYHHIVMLDNYYYDGNLPEYEDRFSKHFQLWVEKKNSEINTSERISKKRKTKESLFRRPHFEIDRKNEFIYLVIPSQKFRSEGYDNTAKVTVVCNGESFEKKLDVYKAYGVIVSEEVKIPIADLFDEYIITISANEEREFVIGKKNYRIFDEDFEESSKLKKGKNYILTRKGLTVYSNAQTTYVDKDIEAWDEYCCSDVCEDTVIYIDNKPVSIAGEFSDKPVFEYVSKEYHLFKDGNEVQTAFRHPVLFFKLPNNALDKSRLYINKQVYGISNELHPSVFKLPNDNESIVVSVILEDIIGTEEGIYSIFLDEPGKSPHLLTKYVLIKNLRCYHERPRYTFKETASISIRTKHDIMPLNCRSNEFNKYEIEINDSEDYFEFALEFEDESYILRVPFNVFRYGFDKKLSHLKLEYLWHSDLKSDFYISMPGASEVFVYLGKDESNRIGGEKYNGDLFRFDLSSFITQIRMSNNSFAYINLKYFDNKWRNVPVYEIRTTVWFEKFELSCDKNGMYINTKYICPNKLFVKIFDNETKELIVEKHLEQGITYFPELSKQGLYDIERYEAVEDDFGFGEELIKLRDVSKVGIIDYDDLSNCKMVIENLIIDENKMFLDCEYAVYDIEKLDDDYYIGTMHFKNKTDGKKGKLIEKIEFFVDAKDRNIVTSIEEYEGENETTPLYYDKAAKNILSANYPIVQKSKDRNRFVELYDNVRYSVRFRRVK